MTLLDDVKREIGHARQQIDSIHLLYLNSYDEVERVSHKLEGSKTKPFLVGRTPKEDIDYLPLLEQAGDGKPYWEICSLDNTGEMVADGDIISDWQLQTALDNAVAERTRFYAEREEAYGPSAWPRATM
jgi:hypothetical protein